MTKLSQAIALATAMTAGLATTAATQAEVSYNAAVTSNYVWRGDAQGADTTALQGGVDYAHESGLAAGIWTSSLAGDTEVDYYASFAGEAGAVSYDLGAIAYDYNTDTADFVEVYASFGVADASVTYYQKVSDNDDDKTTDEAGYLSLGYGLGLADDLALDLAVGHTVNVNTEDSEADKYDVLVSLTKSLPEFDFSLTATDKEDGENEFFITVAKSF
jgi:uncharacterized protein (TIGR02001 family)